ncbi:hypothetical protein CQW23_09311 [Capsicum baccatum]|uniref:Uncharacterized protein n=1 Tax=Capsicum baccatum TaxID=33114 RepID=A0A2G2WWE5_CAPBA|nr:hypothetical protein CQW23_09311 [Capsicum baccatum]
MLSGHVGAPTTTTKPQVKIDDKTTMMKKVEDYFMGGVACKTLVGIMRNVKIVRDDKTGKIVDIIGLENANDCASDAMIFNTRVRGELELGYSSAVIGGECALFVAVPGAMIFNAAAKFLFTLPLYSNLIFVVLHLRRNIDYIGYENISIGTSNVSCQHRVSTRHSEDVLRCLDVHCQRWSIVVSLGQVKGDSKPSLARPQLQYGSMVVGDAIKAAVKDYEAKKAKLSDQSENATADARFTS